MSPLIFESPDGGHTVYQRSIGSAPNDRKLHSISDEKRSMFETLKEDQLWGQVRRRAKQDPALQEVLDRAKLIYTLKYANTSNHQF